VEGIWDTIVVEAGGESPLWAASVLPSEERQLEAVFSPLGEARFALGIETIYEGYLVHYGRPRLFAPPDEDAAILLGDYLYAHGLVRIAALEGVEAVRDLAELISLCAQVRAGENGDDAPAWAATAALLGQEALDDARAALRDRGDGGPLLALARESAGEEAVERALAAHEGRSSK
jgi:hypothetical protein